jgi:hypothetical protein
MTDPSIHGRFHGPFLWCVQECADAIAAFSDDRIVAWDDAKNAELRKERGTGFENVVFDIERGDLEAGCRGVAVSDPDRKSAAQVRLRAAEGV